MLGLGLADKLAAAGYRSPSTSRRRQLGGLAGSTELGGVRVDRFYHAVTTTDRRVLDLADELGRGRPLAPARRRLLPRRPPAEMSTPTQLLTFPGLSAADRARLVRFVLRCKRISDHSELDRIGLEEWTRRICGDRLWERLWGPLFDSKFDGRYDDLPATYLWSRMNRISGTRDRKGHEVMGAHRGRLPDAGRPARGAHPRARRPGADLRRPSASSRARTTAPSA